ncbi:hypothetical protein F4782DRAFT_516618 [Xylaria castorea]|nr:hypothetical protein F4782DRAFT_516618 [Xylaria castorea]
MSSAGDPNRPFGEGGNDDAPTDNRRWPDTDPFLQGRFERTFLADGDTIDFDRVPKLQSWAPYFGVSDLFRVLTVLKKVSTHSKGAQRPLTGVEATAIGEHTAHSLRILAWSQPLSWIFATAAAFAGRRTFKFPFYQPKMKRFDPFSFPTKRTPFLRGTKAAFMWQTIRLFAYVYITSIPTVIVFTSITETSFEAHVMRDERLAPLTEEIRRNTEHSIEQRLRRRVGDGAHQDGQTSQEDGSPNYATQSSTAFERPSSATESSQTAYPSRPYRSQENTSSGLGSRREDDDSDLVDDDDASPVATPSRGREMPSSSSGSSWDRIRQQARSGNPNWEKGDSSGQEQGWAQLRQDKTRNPRDPNFKTDSYSYSNDDEERERRNYEKEQAQKEFDALLEAERHGDGSSSTSRGQRR